MRWESLFEDLESQWESELDADELERRAESERMRLGRLTLRERLISLGPGTEGGQTPTELRLHLFSGWRCTVVPSMIGRDWLSGELVREGPGRPLGCVVSLSAVDRVTIRRSDVGRSLRTAPQESSGPRVTGRIGLPFALRDLCRRRSHVRVGTSAGGEVFGTVDRVARDHVDVAVHPAGVPRREREVSCVEIIPLPALEIVEF